MPFFEWNIRCSETPLSKEIKDALPIPEFILKIVKNRGIDSYPSLMEFAYPQVISLSTPFLLGDMDKAVIRLVEAVNKGENILIFGDKDADGVTSTTIIYRIISKFHGNVSFRVPEGDDHYGITKHAIDAAKEQNISLIITVDCGITAVEEAEYARTLGIDLIITDHHEPLDVLPQALALVNPKLNNYHFPYLAGAGVALKVAQGFAEAMLLKDYYNQEFVVFDIETTGLNPDLNEITEIAAVIIKNGVEINYFQTLVKISGEISAEITKITNITKDMLDQDGIPVEDALTDFLSFIGERTLVGHNIAGFDMKFLRAQLKKVLKKEISNHTIDTLSVARSMFKQLKNHKLETVGQHLGIYVDSAALHRALNDVRLNAEVYRRMVLRKSEPLITILHELFPLAAIGTVADIMPLQSENRIIVRVGIENIKMSATGLITLLRRLNVLETLDAKTIGWTVGPVINSPGRLGEAGLVVSLLTATNINKANELAEQIIQKDIERKNRISALEEEIISSTNRGSIKEDKHIFIVSNNISRGLTGLIASKLSNQFQVPVIIIAHAEDGTASGSVRSTGTFDVVTFLQTNENLFEQYGGHKSAGGFVIKPENISIMKENLFQYMQTWSSENLKNTLDIDDELTDLSLLNAKNIHYMNTLLSPIGSKNPAPNFIIKGITVIEAKPLGKMKEHYLFTLLKGKTEFKAIAWGFAERWNAIKEYQKFDIVGIPEINIWNNIEEVRLQLLDIAPQKKL